MEQLIAAGWGFALLDPRSVQADNGAGLTRGIIGLVNQGLLAGRLAWRQHGGGHTDGPNWKYFIPWAVRELGLAEVP